MTDTDEYPSWREALFSDDKIANIRCALKYLLWHGAYIVLAVVGSILFAGAWVIDKLSRNGGGRAAGAVGGALTDSRTKKAGRIIFGGGVIIYVAGFGAYALYLFISALIANPVATVAATVAIIGGAVVLMLALAYGGPIVKRALRRAGGATVNAASTVGSKAVQTPGIRRVYGNCPVSLEQEPRWFDKIFNR